MAGETLSYTELKNWYTIFNNVISNYGGSLSTKTVPSSGSQAIPSNVNNLFTAINEMANETYLGTQPSLYSTDYTVVASGNKINRSSITPVSSTASKITSIKCRNKISYSCGTNSSGTQSCGTNSNGTNSDGTWGNVSKSDGTHNNGTLTQGTCVQGSKNINSYNSGSNPNGTKSYGYNSYLDRSNGTNSNGTNSCGTNSNVNKTNGSIIDILNANTSY